MYYDAHPAVDGVRSANSPKGLLLGETRDFSIPQVSTEPEVTLELKSRPVRAVDPAAND